MAGNQTLARRQPLIEIIQALEKLDNRGRMETIISNLENMRITPVIQESRLLNVKNIIVDFCKEPDSSKILFSAHYDKVQGSPGANDDASGVSVLLGLCRELVRTRFPVRIVFFDREEAWFRTPILKLGLLGSLYYVFKEKREGIEEVYNLEFCGRGDVVTLWPVKEQEDSKTVNRIEKAAGSLSLRSTKGHFPWYFITGDHLPFRLRGIDAVTLSLLPGEKLTSLETSIKEHVARHSLDRKSLPEPLSTIHSTEDNSTHLCEDSLQTMLSLTLGVVHSFFPEK